MKTKFFAASTAIAAIAISSSLTSCSNDEMIVDEPLIKSEIRFNVVSNRATRSSQYYKDVTDISNFKVSAWVRGAGDANKFGGNDLGNSPYFTAEELSNSVTGSTRAYSFISQMRYWPNNNEVLDFFAWVDNSSEGTGYEFSWDKEYNNAKRPSLHVEGYGDATKMVDVLAANTNTQTNNRTNITYQNTTLSFSHALAQVGVTVKVDNPKIQMQIEDIALVNISEEGDYFFSTKDDNAAHWDITKTGLVMVAESQYKNLISSASLNGEDITKDHEFLVLPTTTAKAGKDDITSAGVAAGKSCFRIKCKIWNIANKTSKQDSDLMIYGDKDKDEAQYLYIPADFAWEKGTKYNYTITFGSGNAGYDKDGRETLVQMDWALSISDWGTPTSSTISE